MKKVFSIIIMCILAIIVSGCSLFKTGSKSTSVTYLAFIEMTEASSLTSMFNSENKILDIQFSDNLIQKMQLDIGVATNPQLSKIKFYNQLIKDGSIYEEINYAASLIFSSYYSNLNLANSASRDFSASIYDEFLDYKSAVQDLKDATARLETVAEQASFIVITDKSLSIGSYKELENFKDAYNAQIVATINFSNKYVSFLNRYIFNTSSMPALMLAMNEQLKLANMTYKTVLAFNETDNILVDYTYTESTNNGGQIVVAENTVGVNFYSDLIQSLIITNTNFKTIIANNKLRAEGAIADDPTLVSELNISYLNFVAKVDEYELLRNFYLTAVNSINTTDLTLSDYLESVTPDTVTKGRLIYVFNYLDNNLVQYYDAYNDLITKLINVSNVVI
ncbi:MAG: hypothetical protein PHO33_02730 [Clostridia bacterium]|nr:hypothetical protein [Clostridia bacterium]